MLQRYERRGQAVHPVDQHRIALERELVLSRSYVVCGVTKGQSAHHKKRQFDHFRVVEEQVVLEGEDLRVC